MICKNCSTNYDDNAPYCPYCGAPNDMAHGSQQSQNEYYNPNAQQGGQYYYNGQPNTQQPNYQYQQQDMNYNPQQMNTEPTKEKIVAGLLAWGAYDGTVAVQSSKANMAILFAFVILPIIANIVSIVVMYFYDLDKQYDQMERELKERRKKLAEQTAE